MYRINKGDFFDWAYTATKKIEAIKQEQHC